MGWNGIGIGWPNASAQATPPPPPPTTERYLVLDCITGEQFDTDLYEIGDFEINDRVTFENNGTATFGSVIGIAENEDHSITITSTGVNSDQCYDNFVNISSYNTLNDEDFFFIIEINSEYANFTSVDEEYEMNIAYSNSAIVVNYIEPGEGEPPYYDETEVYFSGTATIPNYNYEQGVTYEIFSIFYTNIYGTAVSYFDEYTITQPIFWNANEYTDDPCAYHSFLREGTTQNGSTFYASFTNDNC